MTFKYKITSSSQLNDNEEFDLNNFDKLFCENEKKKYKYKETITFKDKIFWKKNKSFNNLGTLLFISGPGRQGNHLMIAVMDNAKQIRSNIGEDSFLDNFFNFTKIDEKKTLSIIKNPKKNIDFILKLSGKKKFNKWKKLWLLWKKQEKPDTWSGIEGRKHWVTDYKNYLPKINYPAFEKYLNDNRLKIAKCNNFMKIFEIYLKATNLLFEEDKNFKINFRYSGSGLRRELLYLMNNCENIQCIVPIRRFESFYYTISKSYFGNSKLNQKKLNEAWEHWRHKVLDYLILKKRYPKNFHLVRFEDLTKKPTTVFNSLMKKLKIKEKSSNFKVTILGKSVDGNSSFFKTNKKNKYGIYKQKYKNNLSEVILPKEYKKIIGCINKYSIL
jgi:hypothetical protein|tara:strand:+ start:101 stop:1258 length:1158 start_codon:yes stop_codon:yes gene_type:complete